MSGEHNQNNGGIPTFIDREFIGYLICNCKPWQGYWTLLASEDRPLYAYDLNITDTQQLMHVEIRFNKYASIRNKKRYECWIAEVYKGSEYIRYLRKDQFISISEAHGWITTNDHEKC